MTPDVASDWVTYALDLVAILLGALLGASVAARERLDVTGTIFLAIAAGVGGGMIRDVLISAGPPLALTRVPYLVVAVAGATVILVVDVPASRVGGPILQVLDALLLGFLTAAGCQRAADAELPVLAIGLLGVITAVGGGMLRDLLVGRSPAVLQGGTPYASVTIISAGLYVVLDELGVDRSIAVGACVALAFVLRMAALHWGVQTSTTPQPLGPRRLVRRARRRD